MGHNTIEINGKRYDALSGKLLSDQPSSPPHNHQNKTRPQSGQVIDGFVKRPKKAAHKPSVASHAVHTKATHSKTLMRRSVKKPDAKQTHHTQKTAHHTPIDLHNKPKVPVDHARADRAAAVQKSKLISKFGEVGSSVAKHAGPIPVKHPPKHVMSPHAVSTPIEQMGDTELDNPFDLALQNADSHTQPKTKKPSLRHRTARKLSISSRSLNVAAGVFIALFVGGLFAYQNIPQLAIHLASTRAGVQAKLPSYQPSGFSLSGPVQYGSGSVTLSYASHSDDRNFRIVQKSTDWNSEALKQNFVAAQENHQTIEDKGRTVFIYNGNNATWVSGGVWYQIEGEAELSSDQLRRIVSGL